MRKITRKSIQECIKELACLVTPETRSLMIDLYGNIIVIDCNFYTTPFMGVIHMDNCRILHTSERKCKNVERYITSELQNVADYANIQMNRLN